jgi:PAS domain S-box-containing protein
VTDAMLGDPARLEALRRTALLDTPPEEAFDRLTRLAARILAAPVSLVTLVDRNRQFFKSGHGLGEPWASRRQTPLSHSFCRYAVAHGEPFVVEDAREDPRVHDNLAVPELGVVAYAGVPLFTNDGHALGSLCVIDSKPRRWREEELAALEDLAAAAMTEVELRTLAQEAARESALLAAVLEQSPHGFLVSDAHGRLVHQNEAAVRIWAGSATADDVEAWGQYRAFHPDGRPYAGSDWAMARCLSERVTVEPTEHHIQRFDGTFGWLLGSASPLLGRDGELLGAVAAFADITDLKDLEASNRARALEINDDVIQSVSAAKLALEVDREQQAREALEEALGAARKIVNDLLASAGSGALDPGSLRRRAPAAK